MLKEKKTRYREFCLWNFKRTKTNKNEKRSFDLEVFDDDEKTKPGRGKEGKNEKKEKKKNRTIKKKKNSLFCFLMRNCSNNKKRKRKREEKKGRLL